MLSAAREAGGALRLARGPARQLAARGPLAGLCGAGLAAALLVGLRAPQAEVELLGLLLAALAATALDRFGGRRQGRLGGYLALAAATAPLSLLIGVPPPFRDALAAPGWEATMAGLAWTWRIAVMARGLAGSVPPLPLWSGFVAPASIACGAAAFARHYARTEGLFGPHTPRDQAELGAGYLALVAFGLVVPIAIAACLAIYIMLRDDEPSPSR